MNLFSPIRCRSLLLVLLSATLSFTTSHAQTQTQDGPNAVIADTAEGGGQGGGVFFMVTAINGTEVSDTALTASTKASWNRGMDMRIRDAQRPVPAGQVTLRLHGTEATAAPIQTVFRTVFRDGNREVSGTVTVHLTAGQSYRARGIIDAFKREIWLEDAGGTRVPGSQLAAPPDLELIKQMEGASFITTNLHHDGDWISEVPRLELPYVPIGSRLKIVEWGKDRARILVDGRKMRIGIDDDENMEIIQELVARVTSPVDPRTAMAAYPDSVRNAIRAARVSLGMTKEQVLQALGRPLLTLTPDLAANEWRYEIPDQGPAFLVFDERGQLTTLDASRPARALMLMAPQ